MELPSHSLLAFPGRQMTFNPQSAACSLLQLSSFSAASTSPVAGAREETAKSSSSGNMFSCISLAIVIITAGKKKKKKTESSGPTDFGSRRQEPNVL